jgi:hypothetical protein
MLSSMMDFHLLMEANPVKGSRGFLNKNDLGVVELKGVKESFRSVINGL